MMNLKNLKEADFEELYWIARDRLHPGAISVWFIVTLVMSGIPALQYRLVYSEMGPAMGQGWILLKDVLVTLFLIQLSMALIFLIPYVMYHFQRLQAVWLNFVAIKVSVDFYGTLLLMYVDGQVPIGTIYYVFFIIGAGFLFFILMTLRGIRRAKNGELRSGGKLLYDFQNKPLPKGIAIVLAVIIIGGPIIAHLIGYGPYLYGTVLMAIVQFGIGVGYPEFFLLMYCKFRFPGFIIEPEKRERQKFAKIKPKVESHVLTRYAISSLTVLGGMFIYTLIGMSIGRQELPLSETMPIIFWFSVIVAVPITLVWSWIARLKQKKVMKG
jgi:hypothetical protein